MPTGEANLLLLFHVLLPRFFIAHHQTKLRPPRHMLNRILRHIASSFVSNCSKYTSSTSLLDLVVLRLFRHYALPDASQYDSSTRYIMFHPCILKYMYNSSLKEGPKSPSSFLLLLFFSQIVHRIDRLTILTSRNTDCSLPDCNTLVEYPDIRSHFPLPDNHRLSPALP